MSKPMFCICKNIDEDQLRCKREADQRLCFRYIDTEIVVNFRTQDNLAVIYLKFKQRCQTLGYFTKKMQMEKQPVKTLTITLNFL